MYLEQKKVLEDLFKNFWHSEEAPMSVDIPKPWILLPCSCSKRLENSKPTNSLPTQKLKGPTRTSLTHYPE